MLSEPSVTKSEILHNSTYTRFPEESVTEGGCQGQAEGGWGWGTVSHGAERHFGKMRFQEMDGGGSTTASELDT